MLSNSKCVVKIKKEGKRTPCKFSLNRYIIPLMLFFSIGLEVTEQIRKFALFRTILLFQLSYILIYYAI